MRKQYTRTQQYSLHPGEMVCQLCGRTFKNLHALEAHLRTFHQFSDEDSSAYYNQYIKSPDEGICVVCGAPTKQHKFRYDKTCCRSHAALAGKFSISLENTDVYEKVFQKQIADGLSVTVSDGEARSEYKRICRDAGSLNAHPNRNKIIIKFQNDTFYKWERDAFSNNPEIRRRLIENRCRYLNKTVFELTDRELLGGFKISGIHESYSHFSPLWSKYFAQKTGCGVIADPFGGWGHHLVGLAAAGCKVYYNDLSSTTAENVSKIASFIGADCAVSTMDAKDFAIPEDCDAVFMCPPYYNTEIYECGPFESREKYDETMMRVISNFKSSNARYMGVIIREDFEYLFDGLDVVSKEVVNDKRSHLSTKSRNEYLYIFHR